jgi:hypothetical protein
MKRVVGLVVLGAVLYVAIAELADLTQTRAEPRPDGASTRIVLDVATRRAWNSELAAVDALIAVCALTVSSEVVQRPERVPEGYELRLEPALGEHAQRRLTGCLEDAIVDRVLGEVVALETVQAET